MKYKVVVLPQAEEDLREIYQYLTHQFSRKEWLEAYRKIKQSIIQLKSFPESGAIFPEVQGLHLTQYRQIIAGMNRIIYEIRSDVVYLHIICDSRREMKAMLTKRLLTSL